MEKDGMKEKLWNSLNELWNLGVIDDEELQRFQNALTFALEGE